MFKLLRYLKKREWLYALCAVVFIVAQVWLDLKMPDYSGSYSEPVISRIVVLNTDNAEQTQLLEDLYENDIRRGVSTSLESSKGLLKDWTYYEIIRQDYPTYRQLKQQNESTKRGDRNTSSKYDGRGIGRETEKYSRLINDRDYSATLRESVELREIITDLTEQLSENRKGRVLSKYVREIAKAFGERYQSGMSIKSITEGLSAIFKAIQDGENTIAIRDKAVMLAKQILNSSEILNVPDAQANKISKIKSRFYGISERRQTRHTGSKKYKNKKHISSIVIIY